jgi:energy-coupling factor transporter ATP-binding protein EcfA2
MLTLTDRIKINPGDRVFIAGQSGTGKTTLALALFNLLDSPLRIIVDIKDDIDNPGWKRCVTIKGLVTHIKKGEKKIIFVPPMEWNRDTEQWNLLFKYLFSLTNCDVYIDEGYAVSSASDVPLYAEVIATRGRSRKVGLWVTCQRPTNIAVVFRSEANHVISFFLAFPEDRDRLEKSFETKLDWGKLKGHSFYYKILSRPVLGPLKFLLKRYTGKGNI